MMWELSKQEKSCVGCFVMYNVTETFCQTQLGGSDRKVQCTVEAVSVSSQGLSDSVLKEEKQLRSVTTNNCKSVSFNS